MYCIANCTELKPKFGDGTGNDNVIECAVYTPYGGTGHNIPEYIIVGEVVKREDHEWVDKQDWRTKK